MAKKKATKKQLANLAKGRAKLAKKRASKMSPSLKAATRHVDKVIRKAKKVRAKSKRESMTFKSYGVTHEFPRAMTHTGHLPMRGTCKHCDQPHSTSQHNAHAVYGHGRVVDKVVPAFALTHSFKSHPLKGAMKGFTSHGRK